MPLHSILAALDKPVKPDVIKEFVNYMKTMPAEHEDLVLQCVEHLDKDQSLGSVLAVAHALNEKEFLLAHRDEDDDPFGSLSKEFDKLMAEPTKKDDVASTLRAEKSAG